MKVLLAIESSGKFGSVAIARANHEYSETESAIPSVVSVDLPTDRGSAQSLADTIDRLLRSENLKPNDLGCIALLSGPGSFTGLRVGIATAKSMAYALSIPVVELDTMDCIHYRTERSVDGHRWMHVLLDAYRGQLFVKTVCLDSAANNLVSSESMTNDTFICDIENLVQQAMAAGVAEEHVFVGPGCERLQRYVAREEKVETVKSWFESVNWMNDSHSTPHARSVAELGWEKWRSGSTLDPFLLLPKYFRSSAAEEKVGKSTDSSG